MSVRTTAPGVVAAGPTAKARDLQRVALHDYAQGRFDLAGTHLRRALRLLESDRARAEEDSVALRVRVMMALSTVEFESGKPDSGASWLAAAQDLAERWESTELLFALVSLSALRTLRGGDFAGALALFQSAERAVASATVLDACVMYLNRGNLRLQRLELDQARRDFDQCLLLAGTSAESADAEELDRLTFKARHNLGYLEFLAGNLPRSLQLMDEAARTPADVSLGISALDHARVLIEAGLSDAADEVLLTAEQEFRRGRLHHELAETQLARAESAILANHLAEARSLAGTARDRFRRRGNDRWRRVAELTLLSADLADGRPPSRLVGPADRLAGEFADLGLDVQSRTAELIAGAALTAAGRTEEAEQRLARLHRLTPRDPITLRVQHRAVTADLLRRTGRTGEARRQVRTGLAELGRHQAKFGSIDLQTASAIHGRRLVALDLEMALSAGRPAGVFDAIERGRAASRRLTAVTPPTGDSAELLAELRQLTEIIKMIGDDPAARADVARMRDRTASLFRQLNAISWRSVGAGDMVTPARMGAVAAAAEAHDRVLISYCQFEGHWSAVVLGRGRPRLVRLPGDARTVELVHRVQADLTVLALPLVPDPLRAAVHASLDRALGELDQLLLAPLRLDDRPLAVVPTGPISTLPWGCLPSLRGRPVEVAPTATSWLWGVNEIDNAGPVRVQSFAGPGLAWAEREASLVGRAWVDAADACETHLGSEASREALAGALASATVVHVAAHGSHMRQNPMFSSLELADGPLFAYEIADRRVPGHVVLSACELGQSTTRVGDEALGLARVLLQLGSQCVVAGVARVNDALAGEVMTDYHARLSAGDDSASALAAAAERHRFVPFVCFGSSWRALGGPPTPTPTTPRHLG